MPKTKALTTVSTPLSRTQRACTKAYAKGVLDGIKTATDKVCGYSHAHAAQGNLDLAMMLQDIATKTKQGLNAEFVRVMAERGVFIELVDEPTELIKATPPLPFGQKV